MNRKVTVVGGAGNVGATVARGIADKAARRCRRHRHRRSEGGRRRARHARGVPDLRDRTRACIGTGDYAESANSDIVVITSGVPRKPGMSRDDLLNVNYKIMQQVTEQVVKYSPNCIIIPVSNPLDAMAQAVYKLTKFPRERVIGMAGVLDSARMRTFIAQGAERVGRERPRLRARRPRRHDGAAAALFDGRRHPDHRADGQGDASIAICDADRRRRRSRSRKLVGTSAWYAPGASVGRDGRGDPARQEEDPAVLGVPAGRVRRPRPVRRRAGASSARAGSSRSSRSS